MNEARAKRAATYPLRLPASIKREAEPAQDGASLNQFVTSAIADKVGAMRTATFCAERRSRADLPCSIDLCVGQAESSQARRDVIPDDLAARFG